MNTSPKLLDQVRDKLWVKHYAIRTEQSKATWTGLNVIFTSTARTTRGSMGHTSTDIEESWERNESKSNKLWVTLLLAAVKPTFAHIRPVSPATHGEYHAPQCAHCPLPIFGVRPQWWTGDEQ